MVLQQCTYFVYIFWKKGILSEASSLSLCLRVMTLLGHCIYACFYYFFKVEAIFKFF